MVAEIATKANKISEDGKYSIYMYETGRLFSSPFQHAADKYTQRSSSVLRYMHIVHHTNVILKNQYDNSCHIDNSVFTPTQ